MKNRIGDSGDYECGSVRDGKSDYDHALYHAFPDVFDGNKRTAQLAANQIMIQGGAGVLRIPVECQKEFSQS